MDKTELKIEQVSVDDLKPADYNPRIWSADARKQLTASIDEFGFLQPIVVNCAPERRGVIIGGNFKLDIAKKKGMKTVPVVWVNLPNIEDEKKLNLRLNKNQGEFDNVLLAEFDATVLGDVGFTSEELDRIFKDDEDEDDFDEEKEAESIVTPNSALGDIYSLGNHRLMCGSATDMDDVNRLMGGGPSRYGVYGSSV